LSENRLPSPRNPEIGRRFVLTGAEKLFLRHACALTPEGRLRYKTGRPRLPR